MIQINNELRDRAFNCAKAHGFHDKEFSDAYYCMLIITELSEAIASDRKGRHAKNGIFTKALNSSVSWNGNNEKEKNKIFKVLFEREIKDTVEDELADVVIRCLDLAGERNLDIDIDLSDVPPMPVGEDVISTFTDFMFGTSAFFFNGFLTLQLSLVAVIGCMLGYAKQFDIDLLWHIEQKMKYNELRPMLNGKKY